MLDINLLKKINKQAENNQYPGYPFQLTGIVNPKDKFGMFGSNGEQMSLEAFFKEFDSILAYQMLGSNLAQKGSWLNGGTIMAEYERFVSPNTNKDDFYLDNLEAIKLYFGFYSAYRQYKDKDVLIWFICDNDCDYVDVKVFDSNEQIEQFIKDYWTE